MQYFYRVPQLSEERELAERIDAAAASLHDRYAGLDLAALGVSDWTNHYLRSKIANLRGNLQLYTYLLWLSLRHAPAPLERLVFVDYGGGSGILSCLAKALGIGTVIYVDIYDVACKDVTTLSRALRLPLDHVVCGDVDDLISYVRSRSLAVDALASYDVLEHIYDVREFVGRLPLLSAGRLSAVFGSGANIRNPLYVRKVTKKHLDEEYLEREKSFGHYEPDTLQAYSSVRKKIIAGRGPALSAQQVDDLARSTRGLRRGDIEKSVDEYLAKGRISYRPDHPTNTCDPNTGNWAEHLMQTDWIEGVFREAGFSAQTRHGYWGASRGAHKVLVKSVLNALLRLLGNEAMCVSPYYVICAERQARR